MKRSRVRLGPHLLAQTQLNPRSDRKKNLKPVWVGILILAGILLINRLTDSPQAKPNFPQSETVLGAEEVQAPPTDYYLYEVRTDDSIFSISQKFQVKWEEVVKLNGLAEPHQLAPGTQLKIPISAQTQQQQFYDNLKKKIYVVEPGDSFVGIAQKLNIPVTDLLRANKDLDSPDHIKPGQILRLP
ncbi:MAG: LysM peptidoglycan-binding domain-containing protein [Candidatus Doudnabacteria bacterium]|nr:LysM peptidoglycan-binding domain-containing protein [Candidatus Doudnabacteria bacterium]